MLPLFNISVAVFAAVTGVAATFTVVTGVAPGKLGIPKEAL
jgi:hypothetical protein